MNSYRTKMHNLLTIFNFLVINLSEYQKSAYIIRIFSYFFILIFFLTFLNINFLLQFTEKSMRSFQKVIEKMVNNYDNCTNYCDFYSNSNNSNKAKETCFISSSHRQMTSSLKAFIIY